MNELGQLSLLNLRVNGEGGARVKCIIVRGTDQEEVSVYNHASSSNVPVHSVVLRVGDKWIYSRTSLAWIQIG